MHNILKHSVPANLALPPALRGTANSLSFPPTTGVTICKRAVTRREHTQQGKSSKPARAGLECQLQSTSYLVLGSPFLLPIMRRTLLTSSETSRGASSPPGPLFLCLADVQKVTQDSRPGISLPRCSHLPTTPSVCQQNSVCTTQKLRGAPTLNVLHSEGLRTGEAFRLMWCQENIPTKH